MSGGREGRPRDVEPVGGGEELVGVFTSAKKAHKFKELARVLRTDIGGLAKPGGQRMEACACGQLLLLAPWDHHNERLTIRRDQCLALNDMARVICEG